MGLVPVSEIAGKLQSPGVPEGLLPGIFLLLKLAKLHHFHFFFLGN